MTYTRTHQNIIPARLDAFLKDLEKTTTSDHVWKLLVTLGQELDLNIVDYVSATDYQNWEQVQFIRTTIKSDWIDMVQDDEEIRKNSTFRQHSVHHLFPIRVGLEYMEDFQDDAPGRALMQKRAAEFGLTAGIAIPLRMEEPGQAAHIVFGGEMSRDIFEDLIVQHGWTLHAGALSAHTRYTELFKTEFCDRNQLTEKQQEFLKLVGQGLLDKQIAFELGISFSTVRQRISIIQNKTGTANRAELAALAMRIGLVPDPLIKKHETDLTVFLSTGDGKQGKETRK